MSLYQEMLIQKEAHSQFNCIMNDIQSTEG